jgi:hypothetical protein
MQEAQRAQRLVLVSGDADLLPVLSAVRNAGLMTTLITTAEPTAARLTLAADERIDVRDLVIPDIPLEDLVAPGGSEMVIRAIMERFKMAHRKL